MDVSICLEFVSSFYQLYFAATFPPTFPQGFVSLYIFLPQPQKVTQDVNFIHHPHLSKTETRLDLISP